jgi:signal transduction histidine kinase
MPKNRGKDNEFATLDSAARPKIATAEKKIVEETPTLLFPSSVTSKELDKLLAQVVDSIAHYTDYPLVAAVIFAEPAINQPRQVVCSQEMPRSLKIYLQDMKIDINQATNILEAGIGIRVEELGFGSYFPITHHEFLGDFYDLFNAFKYEKRMPLADEICWHPGDGLITPILSRRGRLFGLIFLSGPKTGLSPNAVSILPILAFANQIAQSIEYLQNDRVLSKINKELSAEKDRLKKLFNISGSVQEAATLNEKLHKILQGITDIGWQRASLYLYDKLVGLERAVHTESAQRGGRLLSDSMTSERRNELFRTLTDRWNYEDCYYLRYLDSEAQPIIEEFFEGTWLMASHTQKQNAADRWHPLDLLLVPLRARSGRMIGLIHVADPVDDKRPSVAACNILQLYAHESALIVEQASLDEERALLYQREQQHAMELQEANEKLQEVARLRQDFTATLVHDIRSPMTVIAGTLELLMMSVHKNKGDNKLTPNMQHLVESAQTTCKHIVELINQLLDISKMEHSGLQLKKESIHPREIIANVVDECDALAKSKQINLNFGCGEDLGFINADRNYLQRALVNLLSNAIKFTPNSGQIWFEARRVEEKFINEVPVYTMFSVVDSGTGIAAEDLPYVFDPYYQAANHKGQLGTGLGLSIVKRVAAAHGGNVSVKSQVGVGSAFSILIPMDGDDIKNDGRRTTEVGRKK